MDVACGRAYTKNRIPVPGHSCSKGYLCCGAPVTGESCGTATVAGDAYGR